MTISELIEKWKKIVTDLNEKGIPLPMVHDPKTKVGSVTLSLVAFSAGLCGISVLFMLGGTIAKLTGYLVLNAETMAQVKTAFDSSFQFLIASLSAYLGRKFQRDSKGELTSESEEKKDENS